MNAIFSLFVFWILNLLFHRIFCGYTALILARGGSKQVPKKNLAEIGTKTLLKRTIEVAKSTRVFDEVWVSTDTLDIYQEAELAGAKVFGRSAETASDTATSFEAVKEFYDFFPNLTVIALLQCTSPFQSPIFLRKAHFLMEQAKYDSVFSVVRNVKLLWRKYQEDTFVPLNFDIKMRPRRQDIRDEFAENGMFYWFRTKLIFNGALQGGKVGVVEIPPGRSLEIDTYDNLYYAKYMAPALIPVIEWEKYTCLPEEEHLLRDKMQNK